MPSITNPGSLLYPSGNELTPLLLTTSGATALGTTNVNNLTSVYSTALGATLKMPAAANLVTSGFVAGQTHFPIINHRSSQPLLIRNGGTQGSEATLEKVLAPSAIGRMTLYNAASGVIAGTSYTANAGLWNWESEGPIDGVLNMPVPLSYGVPGIPSNLSFNVANETMFHEFISGTLSVALTNNASNDIICVPFQVSTDGNTQVSGAAVTVKANGGAALSPTAIRAVSNAVGNTQALVTWNDSTNKKNGFVVVTVASGATPVLTAGSVTDDTALATASGQRIQSGFIGMTQDGGTGPNMWFAGAGYTPQNTTQVVYYLTIAQNTSGVTLTASGAFGGQGTGSAAQTVASVATGSALIWGQPVANGLNMNLYYGTVSGSTITQTWVASGVFINPASDSQGSSLLNIETYVVDPAQSSFVTFIGGQANANSDYIISYSLNLASGTLLNMYVLSNPLTTFESGYIRSTTVYYKNLGDGQFGVIRNASVPSAHQLGAYIFGLFDFRNQWQMGTGSGSSIGGFSALPYQYGEVDFNFPFQGTFGYDVQYSNPFSVHIPTRRMCFIKASMATLYNGLNMNFLELPRR